MRKKKKTLPLDCSHSQAMNFYFNCFFFFQFYYLYFALAWVHMWFMWHCHLFPSCYLYILRATTSEVAKLFKIQKMYDFTHFNKKHPHQSMQKCANIQKCYNNCTYMHSYYSFAFDYLNIFSLSTLTLISSISSLESSAQYSKPPPTTQFSNPQPPNLATYHHHHHYKIAIHNKPTTNSKENQIVHTRTHNRDIEREGSGRELNDGTWWSGFWLVADDGAQFIVAVHDGGGLIVDGGLGCVCEDFKRREKCEGWKK